MNVFKYFPVVLCLVVLTGCVHQYDPLKAGMRPYDRKEVMKAYIKKTFFDPYSIRDASITNVIPGYINFQDGWILCVELNAKNRMGGYIGLSKTAYLVRNEEVVLSVQHHPICSNNRDLIFEPWPEIEGTSK